MKPLNPALQSQVQDLAQLCCDVLERREVDSSERAQPLIEALVRNGYARLSDINLQTRVEELAVEQCRETAIHRRDELMAITGQMQTLFNDRVKWHSQSPADPEGSQAANISSNTDA
jgi:hypothetical protein